MACRSTHLERHAQRVALDSMLVGDNDAVGVQLFGPHECDLSVNQTIVNTNLCDHMSSFPLVEEVIVGPLGFRRGSLGVNKLHR